MHISTFFISLLFFFQMVFSLPINALPETQEIQAFLKEMFASNIKHIQTTELSDFKKIAEGQEPRATVVMCSDSRVQASAINESAENDCFFIRNIGNQINTATGSVEYGVRHLHTPVLLIIGHSACGAVKAALGDFSKESQPIQQELRSLNLNSAQNVDQGVVENIHHQVEVALKEFDDLIQENKLVVIGLVYDFRDDFKQGHGRLILINLNGEQDVEKLKKNDYLSGIKDTTIGIPTGELKQ
jgi:carbonic anhydrase